MSSMVRGLVSKRKRRFQADGFDLDLVYVTSRLIAMGFPSSGFEAFARNPVSAVRRFLDHKHGHGHYLVVNLCSERQYSIEDAFPMSVSFPFDDHRPPPLHMIADFCSTVFRFLAESEDNVVAVHCKAGKGRTGVMLSSFLVHIGALPSAMEALVYFGWRRAMDGNGVTIPSQMRYVWYYEQQLRRKWEDVGEHSKTLAITSARLVTVPDFDLAGGCDPYVRVYVSSRAAPGGALVFDQRARAKTRIRHAKLSDPVAVLDLLADNVVVRDNVRIELWDADLGGGDDRMGAVTFHTAFVDGTFLSFSKAVVDGACKDKGHRRIFSEFTFELYFREVEPMTETEYASTILGISRPT